MLDIILNFIEMLVVAFGYGTINYFTFLFWTALIVYMYEKANKAKIKTSIKVELEDVKDIQEEKTEK